MWMLVGSVAAAALCAFGLLCAVRALLDCFGRDRVSVAVRIADDAARKSLDVLLYETRAMGLRGPPVVVLFDAAQLALQPLTMQELAILSRYGAQPLCVLQQSDHTE